MKMTQVANLDIDDMVTYGGGFAWTLPFAQRGTYLIAEVDGTTVVRNPRKLTSPIEWLAGVRQRVFDGLNVEVAGGRGITSSVGGGDWRIVAGLHWSPTLKAEARGEKEVLLETVYFGFNKDKFLPKYNPRFDTVAEKIKADKKRIKIRGHTDTEGTEEYNVDLSRRRARGVEGYLVEKGVRKTATEAVGSKEPVTGNQTAKDKAKNRRVEILEMP